LWFLAADIDHNVLFLAAALAVSSLHTKHPQDSLLWVHNRQSIHYQDSTALFLSSQCRKISFILYPVTWTCLATRPPDLVGSY